MPIAGQSISARFRQSGTIEIGLALGCLWVGSAWAQPQLPAPVPPPPVSFHVPVTSGLIRAYQTIISPSKGSHCPMTPHCSEFGMQAFTSRNPLSAFIMTSDRLHRCGHDLQYYEATFVDAQLRFADAIPTGRAAVVSREVAPTPTTRPITAIANDGATDERAATNLLDFAESLEAWGDHTRAITEYLRFLHDFPGDPRSCRAQVGLIRAHYQGGAHEEVIRWGRQAPVGCATEDAAEVQYYVGLAFLSVRNENGAQRMFGQVQAMGIEPYRSKAAMLAATSLAREFRWQEAGDAFAAIGPDNPFVEFARRDIVVCAQGASPDLKNPTKAGLLSIVPGAGYLYAGHPKTAISAFLVTSGFLWATVEAFDRDNQGLGVLMSILSFGWYSGNIYGAVGSANRYNEWATQTNLAKLEFGFAF